MPTHPAPVHNDSHAHRLGAQNEFKTHDLRDPRRDRRLKMIAADWLAQPGASIPKASGGWAGAKAACRFFDNDASEPAAVLAAHRQAVIERARDTQTRRRPVRMVARTARR